MPGPIQSRKQRNSWLASMGFWIFWKFTAIAWFLMVFIFLNEYLDPILRQLAKRENLNCGTLHSIAVNGTDIRIRAEQTEVK